MDHAMPQEDLEKILDEAVVEVTEQTGFIHLDRSDEPLGGDLCTVHIAFSKSFHTSLSVCADTALLTQMAQNIMCVDEVSPQDLEEFGKEYLNILGGRIASVLFKATQKPARLTLPAFYRGRHVPEEDQIDLVLSYSGGPGLGAQLIHHRPQP